MEESVACTTVDEGVEKEQPEFLRGVVLKLRVTKKAHRDKLLKTMASSRFAYNWCISKYLEEYKRLNPEGQSEIKLPPQGFYQGLAKEFRKYKRDFKTSDTGWLWDTEAIATEVLSFTGFLRRAFKIFYDKYFSEEGNKEIWDHFKGQIAKGRKMSFPYDAKYFPNYKSAFDSYQSYKTRLGKFSGNTVYLPKIGYIPVWNWQDIPVNVKKEGVVSFDGKDFFLSVITTRDEVPGQVELSGVLGIDMGLSNLATLSDGSVIKSPADLDKAVKLEKLIKKYQHRYDILKKYSKVVQTEDGRVIKKMSRKARRMRDLKRRREVDLQNLKDTFIKQAVSKIKQKGYKTIVIETLSIKAFQRNKCFSTRVQKSGIRKFMTFLESSVKPLGTEVIKADRFFASSQICSNCGFKNTEMKNPSIRVFSCPDCGMVLDRDLNAAINLKNYGERVDK